jgi:hypothetical protein
MDCFGGMWLDPERNFHGRPALSIELLYSDNGAQGVEALAPGVGHLLDLGVRVLLRVDKRPGQTIPTENDFNAKRDYTHFIGDLGAHPVFKRVHGFIIGNEPNLKGENTDAGAGHSPQWYMRTHSGAGAADGDHADNAWFQLRQRGYAGDVLIAAVAPWSDDRDGTLDFYPTPPGATDTMHWHRYAATLYWLAFNASLMPHGDVKGAIHTYSNVLRCTNTTTAHLVPADEPTFANALREPNFKNCQYGIRVYEEFRQQMDTQAHGTPVPHYVTEWNSMVGRTKDDLTDGAWPCNNYPQGLLRAAVKYLAPQDHLLGFGVFVDKDPSGATPFWRASAARGHVNGTVFNPDQRSRLSVWDDDMDEIFANGW